MITKLKENLKKPLIFNVTDNWLIHFLSLFSYNKNDNSLFSYNSLNLENHNYFGVLGSIISSSLGYFWKSFLSNSYFFYISFFKNYF